MRSTYIFSSVLKTINLLSCNFIHPYPLCPIMFTSPTPFLDMPLPLLPCRPYSCDNMEKLRRRCETLEIEIKEKWKFKDFYQFTFNFAKNPGQKSLGGHISQGLVHCVIMCLSVSM